MLPEIGPKYGAPFFWMRRRRNAVPISITKLKDKDPDAIDAEQVPATRRMAEKLACAETKACSAKCKWISEAVNG